MDNHSHEKLAKMKRKVFVLVWTMKEDEIENKAFPSSFLNPRAYGTHAARSDTVPRRILFWIKRWIWGLFIPLRISSRQHRLRTLWNLWCGLQNVCCTGRFSADWWCNETSEKVCTAPPPPLKRYQQPLSRRICPSIVVRVGACPTLRGRWRVRASWDHKILSQMRNKRGLSTFVVGTLKTTHSFSHFGF